MAKLPAAPRPLAHPGVLSLAVDLAAKFTEQGYLSDLACIRTCVCILSLHNPWSKRSPALAPIHLITSTKSLFAVGS
jgi:hypothetical protein